MPSSTRIYFGREISEEDISMIQWTVSTFTSLSRTELSATVAESLGWLTPAGKPQAIQCRSCLEALEAEGLITLPAVREAHAAGRRGKSVGFASAPEGPLVESVTALGLAQAKSKADRLRWRSYVQEYHYLGYVLEFGPQLRYFIIDKSDGAELGCIQFSAAAWALAPRDKWIGWDKAKREANLGLIVKNSRFLIYPWVRVRNLASRALALTAKQLPGDWEELYGYKPALMETFVDSSKFAGTSYKAANWAYLGQTKGRGRGDTHHENAAGAKAIYVMPLCKDYRRVLLGKAPEPIGENF